MSSFPAINVDLFQRHHGTQPARGSQETQAAVPVITSTAAAAMQTILGLMDIVIIANLEPFVGVAHPALVRAIREYFIGVARSDPKIYTKKVDFLFVAPMVNFNLTSAEREVIDAFTNIFTIVSYPSGTTPLAAAITELNKPRTPCTYILMIKEDKVLHSVIQPRRDQGSCISFANFGSEAPDVNVVGQYENFVSLAPFLLIPKAVVAKPLVTFLPAITKVLLREGLNMTKGHLNWEKLPADVAEKIWRLFGLSVLVLEEHQYPLNTVSLRMVLGAAGKGAAMDCNSWIEAARLKGLVLAGPPDTEGVVTFVQNGTMLYDVHVPAELRAGGLAAILKDVKENPNMYD